MSKLEDLIERNPHPLVKEHSDLVGASGDLPTPPYGHPSEEGICRREIMLLTKVRLPKLQIFSRPIVND